MLQKPVEATNGSGRTHLQSMHSPPHSYKYSIHPLKATMRCCTSHIIVLASTSPYTASCLCPPVCCTSTTPAIDVTPVIPRSSSFHLENRTNHKSTYCNPSMLVTKMESGASIQSVPSPCEQKAKVDSEMQLGSYN